MNKLYRPREIAQLGLIRNSTGGNNVTSNYEFVVKLLKTGKLKGRNYGVKSRNYWLVPSDEIERYNSSLSN